MGCISTKPSVPKPTIHTERSLGHATEIVPMPFVVGDDCLEKPVAVVANSVILENSYQSPPESNHVDDIVAFTPSEDISAMPVSPFEGCADSRIAENASSQLESSRDNTPSTPGPIVSPNPGSPRLSFFGIMSKISDVAELPTVVEEVVVDAPANPPIPVETVPTPAPIESANTTYLSAQSSRPAYPSRLGEVAAQKNLKLCMQILAFWRSGILKEKLDSVNLQLDETGRASALVLSENEALKARVAELERAIIVTNGVVEASSPDHGISVATETCDIEEGFLTPSSTCPPQDEFASPELPTLATLPVTLFKSPVSVKAAVHTWEEHMRPGQIKSPVSVKAAVHTWEEHMRPSPKISGDLPTAAQSGSVSRSNSISKDKLREISADLQRLSESLAARQSGSVFSRT